MRRLARSRWTRSPTLQPLLSCADERRIISPLSRISALYLGKGVRVRPETMKTENGEEFLIGRGAPFFELQRQIGLVREKSLNSGRRALVFVFATAVVPVVLALLTGGAAAAQSILTEPAFLVRFVLFVAICFLMEGSLETRLQDFLKRFDQSELLDDAQRRKGALAVAHALKLRNLATADAVCLVLAIIVAIAALRIRLVEGGVHWVMDEVDGQRSLSPAGWWITTVSSTIFWFLIFRWLWRMSIWAILLHWISRLDMRLVAAHPDRLGGIGFIATYPNAFAPLVFALSSVPAAAVFEKLSEQTLDIATYGTLMTAWLAVVLAVFLLPLLSFRHPLERLKQTTLKEADILSTRFQRASERKIFNQNLFGPPDEAVDGEVPDPSGVRKAASSLSTVPFSRHAVLPLSVAALAPLLIAGATQLPFKELLKTAKGLLVL
jgi:hypothetical protein